MNEAIRDNNNLRWKAEEANEDASRMRDWYHQERAKNEELRALVEELHESLVARIRGCACDCERPGDGELLDRARKAVK